MGNFSVVVVRIRLLGGFDVAVDGEEIASGAWPSRRARQLVALLALAPHRRLSAEQVMDALWPELDAEAARANLHKAATYARRALRSREAVVLRGGFVTLWPGARIVVDAEDFETAARRALDAGAGGCGPVADAYGGDLLPDDLYEDWTVVHRERLKRLHRELLRGAGRWAELVELDGTDEEAHRAVMAEHHRAGRLHAAIRQFQRLRAVLAKELGVAPSSETLSLYRSIIGSSPSGWIRPALVGREVELVRARAALRRAAEDRPAAILVTGPAGIGKTRLCEELAEQAAADGWWVLRSAATAESAVVPYGPLVEALEATVLQRPALADALDARDRNLLVRLAGSGGGEPPGVHRHTIVRLVTSLVRAAGGARAALFIDDLHLADEATVGIAAVLASAPPPRGLLLLAAYREDAASPVLAAAAGGLVASGVAVEIELAALSRHETEQIVEDVAGRPPTAVEADAAWALSEGNPFLALEVASSLSSDVPPGGAGPFAAVTTRLRRISPAARLALRATALVTDEFNADVVAAAAGLAPDAALEVLGSATDGRIVAGTNEGTYRFRHDLLRDALTRDAADDERRTAHATFADWLTDQGAAPGRVAQHLIAAGREQAAIPFLRSAAGQAIGVGAHRDAVALTDTALAITPGDADLLGLRADALFGAGDPGAAAAYAVAIAASDGNARGALGVRRARALILNGDIPGAIETLDGVVTTEPVDEVQHLVTRGLARWCTGELDEAASLGNEARRLAEQSGNVRDFVDATLLQAMVAHERGAWPQQAAHDLLDAQIRPELASLVIDAFLCVAESYLYGGVPYPEVIAFATDLRDRAARAGTVHAEAFATTLLGEAHLLTGELHVAKDLLATALKLYRRVGLLCGEALTLQRLAEASVAAGDRSAADGALAEALAAARGSPVATRHLLDRIHGTAIRAAGDSRAALIAVDEATRSVRGPLESCPPCSISRTIPSAVACADGGDTERARAFLAAAEQVVAAFYRRGGWHAALDEARAHLAKAEGDAEAAGRLLRQAIDGYDRAGQTLDAERCRAVLTAGKV